MQKKVIFFLATWLICHFAPGTLFAWNFQGHQVVAQIAYNHLDAEVKAKCHALIKVPGLCSTSTNDTFVSASTWADFRCETGTSPEHYLDIPISLDGSPTGGVLDNPTNVVAAITRHIQTLKNPASDVTNQARALRYLIHFVGDAQQPLHCSTGVTSNRPAGDAGGNSFSLGNVNLHSFWDGGGGYLTNGASVAAMSAAVEAAYTYSTSYPAIPDPMVWVEEGYDVARTNAYVGITNGFFASATYSNRVQSTTKQRIALGGQRLAKLISSILVTNAPILRPPVIDFDGFKLSFDAVPGRVYRVQAKSQIWDAVWNDQAEFMAITNSVTYTNSLNESQRFFRVAIVN